MVTVGSGPVVVDVYEDYLCPICERFEERYGSDLTTALNNNQITVRYHSIAILDELHHARRATRPGPPTPPSARSPPASSRRTTSSSSTPSPPSAAPA